MFPYSIIKQQGDRQREIDDHKKKQADSLARIQANCDHDWENIGDGQKQCTYLECQKIEYV